jgi:hypothetical protein
MIVGVRLKMLAKAVVRMGASKKMLKIVKMEIVAVLKKKTCVLCLLLL